MSPKAETLARRITEALSQCALHLVKVHNNHKNVGVDATVALARELLWSPPVDEEVYYLKSCLTHLRQFKELCNKMKGGTDIGSECLADNVDWLDCHIDKLERSRAS